MRREEARAEEATRSGRLRGAYSGVCPSGSSASRFISAQCSCSEKHGTYVARTYGFTRTSSTSTATRKPSVPHDQAMEPKRSACSLVRVQWTSSPEATTTSYARTVCEQKKDGRGATTIARDVERVERLGERARRAGQLTSWKSPQRWLLVSMPSPIERPPIVMSSISICSLSAKLGGSRQPEGRRRQPTWSVHEGQARRARVLLSAQASCLPAREEDAREVAHVDERLAGDRHRVLVHLKGRCAEPSACGMSAAHAGIARRRDEPCERTLRMSQSEEVLILRHSSLKVRVAGPMARKGLRSVHILPTGSPASLRARHSRTCTGARGSEEGGSVSGGLWGTGRPAPRAAHLALHVRDALAVQVRRGAEGLVAAVADAPDQVVEEGEREHEEEVDLAAVFLRGGRVARRACREAERGQRVWRL